MSKKIIGLLLVLCLIVGLLPMVASAAGGTATIKFGFTSHKLTGYDTPIYTVNYSTEAKDTAGNTFTSWGQTTTGATEENYNAKIIWHTGDKGPTIYLRNFKLDELNNATDKLIGKKDDEGNYTSTAVQTYAISIPAGTPSTIVLQGEQNVIEAKFGITYKSDLTIRSEGNAKLSIYCQSAGISTGLASDSTSSAALTLNANLDVTVLSIYSTAWSHTIMSHNADLTINGGNINLVNKCSKQVSGIVVSGQTGNVVINGGTITTNSVVSAGATNGAIKANNGSVIINGGEVNVNPNLAVGIWGKTGVEINGGTVNITTPYYGINAGNTDNPADICINGGTVEIVSGSGGFYKAPVLGAGVDGFAGPNEEDADFYDDTTYKKPWIKLTGNGSGSTTKPSTGTTTSTTAPTTQATTAGTTGTTVTTTPTTQATTATTGTTTSTTAPTTGTTAATTQATTAATTQATTQATTAATTQATTQTTTAATQSTTKATTAATKAPTTANNADDGESGNVILWVVAAVILVAGVAAVVLILKKRK